MNEWVSEGVRNFAVINKQDCVKNFFSCLGKTYLSYWSNILPCHVIKKKLVLWILFEQSECTNKKHWWLQFQSFVCLGHVKNDDDMWCNYCTNPAQKTFNNIQSLARLLTPCIHSHRQRGKSQYFMLNGSFVHAFCFSLSFISWHG